MRILFQILYPEALNAGRTIYHGYRNAFLDLGHEFRPVTALDDFAAVLDGYQPDILMTSLNRLNLRFLDLKALARHRKRGMKVLVNTPFWRSPMSKLRINEAGSLKDDEHLTGLIRGDEFGDVFYNSTAAGDLRMDGFERATGRAHATVPLAADKIVLRGEARDEFKADISYIGTYLPEKRPFFRRVVFPLRAGHSVRLYGQDWTAWDRAAGWAQKFGQYFRIPLLRDLRKPRLRLEEEGFIYASSAISINVHEAYQREFGGDCNERTFKIPLCDGFEITDDVACIRTYFKAGEEIVVAESERDFLEKIDHYLRHPEERLPIMRRGRERVLREHTYHNRAATLLDLAGR